MKRVIPLFYECSAEQPSKGALTWLRVRAQVAAKFPFDQYPADDERPM